MALADPMVGSPLDRAERICARHARASAPRRSSFRASPAPATAPGGRDHRPTRPRAAGHARAGDRSAADHRRDGADPPHAAGSPGRNGARRAECRCRRNMHDNVNAVRSNIAYMFMLQPNSVASEQLAMTHHDLCRNRRRIADHQGRAARRRTRRDVLAAGVVDQGIEQDALAEALLDRLLRTSGLRRDGSRVVVATGYGRKLIRGGRRRRSPRSPARPGACATCVPDDADDHRHRRTGQQAPAAARRRHGRRFRDERPLRRRHRPVSGSAGHAAGRPPGVPRRAGRPQPQPGDDQQHVRGVCRDGDHRAAGLGRGGRGHRGRRAGVDRHARGGHGRAATCPPRSCSPAAWRWCPAWTPRWDGRWGSRSPSPRSRR